MKAHIGREKIVCHKGGGAFYSYPKDSQRWLLHMVDTYMPVPDYV